MINIKSIFFLGNNIIYLNEPYKIEFLDFINPGKGNSFIRTKIRNLINNKLIDKNFKSFNNIKKANIFIDKYVYIYEFKNNWFFINNNNYNEIILNKNIILKYKYWIYVNNIYDIIFWNKIPISINIPKYIYIKVIYITNNKEKKRSKNNIAILSTGLKIKVPNFINCGDLIKINTKYRFYISRYK